MGLSPIDYNFLNLTGSTRGIGAIGGQPHVAGTSTGGNSQEPSITRAIDRLPKCEMVSYEEYLPSQAGREAGFSTKTLIA